MVDEEPATPERAYRFVGSRCYVRRGAGDDWTPAPEENGDEGPDGERAPGGPLAEGWKLYRRRRPTQW